MTILQSALAEIDAEWRRATDRFGPFNSAHEGYAVILEELDELWLHVKENSAATPAARKEAIQVATMAVRFAIEICGSDPS